MPDDAGLEGGNLGNLSGGRDGMSEGDDFLTIEPQKMYVVGRARTKVLPYTMSGPLDFSGFAPCGPRAVFAALEDSLANPSPQAFAQAWKVALQEEYPEMPDFQGSDHNMIQGPGRFAFDIRLMKYMGLRKKKYDVNGNTTLSDALRKLRALHSLLLKVFGPQWILMSQVSANNAQKVDAYFRSVTEPDVEFSSFADPFVQFTPEDLQINTNIFGPDIPEKRAVLLNNEDNQLRGLVFMTSQSPLVLGVSGDPDTITPEYVNFNGFELGKLVVPSTGSLILQSQDQNVLAGGLAGGLAGTTPVSSLATSVEHVTSDMVPVEVTLEAGQYVRDDLQVSTVPDSRALWTSYIEASLSPMDKVSRKLTIQRMDRLTKDPHAMVLQESQGLVFAVSGQHSEVVEELELDLPHNASVVTMIAGRPTQSLREWFMSQVEQDHDTIVVVPTAWDTLGTFGRRMDLTPQDVQRAMPDLETLEYLTSVFDMRPMTHNLQWSPFVPDWSKRHVRKLTASHEMAYELAAARVENRFDSTNASVYGIPFRVYRLRSA